MRKLTLLDWALTIVLILNIGFAIFFGTFSEVMGWTCALVLAFALFREQKKEI